MKRISILALDDATISCIDSAYQVLTRVNDFLKYQGKPPFYEVEIVGMEKQTPLSNGLYNIQLNRTIDEIKKTDVVILPMTCGDFPGTNEKNKKYVDWVTAQYQGGAEILCLCVGSFFFASTGLLDGLKCAVHWAATSEFTAMFPLVKVVDDNIITDEDGIYTCGGGYSYLNLLLYIIEKHLGRDLAILSSKMFEIDIERKTQNAFMIFLGQKKHGDEIILKAQQLIENNPTELFTVEAISDGSGIGRRTFERRFKKGTGNSVSEYIQRVKVEFTKKQLESNKKTVNEIIYETGYNDINAFRKIFKKYTDLSPAAYRQKYSV